MKERDRLTERERKEMENLKKERERMYEEKSIYKNLQNIDQQVYNSNNFAMAFFEFASVCVCNHEVDIYTPFAF